MGTSFGVLEYEGKMIVLHCGLAGTEGGFVRSAADQVCLNDAAAANGGFSALHRCMKRRTISSEGRLCTVRFLRILLKNSCYFSAVV
jgi:hypothetical protein